jgi:hypothetical protein
MLNYLDFMTSAASLDVFFNVVAHFRLIIFFAKQFENTSVLKVSRLRVVMILL